MSATKMEKLWKQGSLGHKCWKNTWSLIMLLTKKLINGFCKKGNAKVKLYNEMVGNVLDPDVITYSLLINVHSKGLVHQAMNDFN
jgi:hypothetical protein